MGKELFKHNVTEHTALEAMDNGLKYDAASMIKQMTKTIQDQLKTCIHAVAKQMKLDVNDKIVMDCFKLINEHAVSCTSMHLRYSLFFSSMHIGMIVIKADGNEFNTVFTPDKDNQYI